MLPVPSTPCRASRGTDTRTGATDFTTTNTQEKDVDEPDFVKNDGSRIFALHGGSLVVVAAWPPESARVESVTPLEGQPTEMFLAGDRVAVYSRLGNPGFETFGPRDIVSAEPRGVRAHGLRRVVDRSGADLPAPVGG